MAKLESSFMNMTLVLTGISLFAAVALASVYSVTKGPIEAAGATKQQNAVKEVLPAFERLDAAENVEMDGIALKVYRAYDGSDGFVGAAVESVSKNGFNGEIKVMVGFDKDGNIAGYAVLEQKETPGLGTKMVDWFKPQTKTEKSLVEKIFGFEVKAAERKSSVVGKNPARDKLTVSKDGGEIDAITAATISSRAFLETIRYAYAAYKNKFNTDIHSGATPAASTKHKI
jgi:electron transport complex protein RnfG